MPLRTTDQNPSITDTILFDLYTTDENGDRVDPYEVNSVTIFFVERDYVSRDLSQWDETTNKKVTTFYYRDAVPIKVFGTDDFPAWLSSDTTNADLVKVPSSVGHFQLQWRPELCREGDYFICHTWTPIPAGDSFSHIDRFYLHGDPTPPVIPSHLTKPEKYPRLLEQYLPEMFKRTLIKNDLTPDVLHKTNLAVADGFTQIENLYNQLIDLLDGNVVNEQFLPYLANFFRLKLRSQDPTLWRRQVKGAIQLYKKRGTLEGLQEALAAAGITFKKLTYFWQVVSKSTWQEAFDVDGSYTWRLAKRAKLPVDSNFHVWYRKIGTTDWVEIDPSKYTFADSSEATPGCPEGIETYTTLSITDTATQALIDDGDMVRVLYKIAEPQDQQIEDYIQTLPLADNRDEMTITEPVKNWNVRLIAEDDFLFQVVCPQHHAFVYPLVYGKIRTEFPYNENSYNMDEYNGSTRDSNNPCHIDGSFYDTCTCCRSSKVSVDVEIENLSNDRIEECEEIIKDFLPFHAQVQSVNYVGLQDEIIPPPVEELECLIQYNLEDNVICSQFDFNRIIYDGKNDSNILRRNMLADADPVANGNDGVGNNTAIVLFSPGVNFTDTVKGGANILEVLSGVHQGTYELAPTQTATADVIGLTDWPLDQSGFPFRFSNIQYEESVVSVYQDNVVEFTDSEIDFSLFPIVAGTWSIKVKTGPKTGIYPILGIHPDNTLILAGWSGSGATGLNYELDAPGNINVAGSTTGSTSVQNRGRVETNFSQGYDIATGDWVKIGGTQYKILFTDRSDTLDRLYIDGWTGGDQIGAVNVQVLRRKVDTAVGYFNYRGMKLTTTINYETTLGIQDGRNPVANPVDNSDFKDNYFVLVGTTYYQLADIDGQDLYLTGPVQNWGLANNTTGLAYTIIQLVNQSVTPQDGRTGDFNTFDFVDRRGEGSNFVVQQDASSMSMEMRLSMLNKLSEGEVIEEPIQTKEKIWFTVEFKE